MEAPHVVCQVCQKNCDTVKGLEYKVQCHVMPFGPHIGKVICHACYRDHMQAVYGIDVDKDITVNVVRARR